MVNVDWVGAMVKMKSAKISGCSYLKGHNFTSLTSVFGRKGPNKFSHKGNLLAFGEVASVSAHPGRV